MLKAEVDVDREASCYQRGGRETTEDWVHQAKKIPDLVSKYNHNKEIQRQVGDVLDYTDLNKTCPKDCFPLPQIDQLVNSTSGHELLSFMDAFSSYNQIKIDPMDEVHTSFITAFGTYCYKVMPFDLKNAGAPFSGW